ncbi:MAG TPA: response regulator transcription factor [Candidatus Dormibacteraeota bacterium]|nr:response regulator transcription factor [Candidatus Dormibacteraeota bacterium]
MREIRRSLARHKVCFLLSVEAVRSGCRRRAHELDPALHDAALVLATGLPSVAIFGRVDGPAAVAPIAAMTVPLMWRRRWPVAAYVVQCAGLFTAAAVMLPIAQFVLCFLAVLAGAYSTGRHGTSSPRSLAVVTASMVPGGAFAVAHGSSTNAFWFLQLLFAWAIGFSVRRQIYRGIDPAPPVQRDAPSLAVSNAAPACSAANLSSLTRRELEVLKLLARGYSNGELARLLYIGEGTVKTHVARILAKLDLRDRLQAVVLVYESGLVRPQSDVQHSNGSENLP